eukprot:TRINITY_DN61268_c0_g1_i1.p4 TRINITY_DN61268_c0_g1~~TRINITY_DN61268_c0_g1_i1.p4  ORF type:complete len:289 (-),score=132.64 TRINITY_DN61268_c0_g1_i1:974-1840(-)
MLRARGAIIVAMSQHVKVLRGASVTDLLRELGRRMVGDAAAGASLPPASGNRTYITTGSGSGADGDEKKGGSAASHMDKAMNAKVCRPVVVSGPSGVGKGSLIQLLRREFPEDFGFSVSHTTRQPRGAEVDGVDYHFVSKEEFEEQVKQGNFLEYANVHGNYYGTTIQAVNAIRQERKVPLIEIDVQGAQQLHNSGLVDAQFVFVTPPSIKELERRLRGRKTEKESQIKLRVKNASGEISQAQNSDIYDAFLVNRNLLDTFAVFRALLEENRQACRGCATSYPKDMKQ